MAKTLIDIVIEEINERQAQKADTSLRNPLDKTEFGYGFACGFYEAMTEVKQIIKNVLNEEKRRE